MTKTIGRCQTVKISFACINQFKVHVIYKLYEYESGLTLPNTECLREMYLSVVALVTYVAAVSPPHALW